MHVVLMSRLYWTGIQGRGATTYRGMLRCGESSMARHPRAQKAYAPWASMPGFADTPPSYVWPVSRVHQPRMMTRSDSHYLHWPTQSARPLNSSVWPAEQAGESADRFWGRFSSEIMTAAQYAPLGRQLGLCHGMGDDERVT